MVLWYKVYKVLKLSNTGLICSIHIPGTVVCLCFSLLSGSVKGEALEWASPSCKESYHTL
jgi:hypothetical protein